MKYKSEKSNEVYQLIVDYAYLKSFDKNLVGSYIFPYHDIDNNLDVISFYEEKDDSNAIEACSYIEDTRIQFVSLDKKALSSFEDEITSGFLLCDKKGVLSNIKKNGVDSNYIKASNVLELDYDKLSSMLNNKINESSDNKYLSVYYTLVDFYYNIIINTPNFDFVNFNKEIERLLEKKLVLAEYTDFHVAAILEAIALAEKNKIDKNKELKLVNNNTL